MGKLGVNEDDNQAFSSFLTTLRKKLVKVNVTLNKFRNVGGAEIDYGAVASLLKKAGK